MLGQGKSATVESGRGRDDLACLPNLRNVMLLQVSYSFFKYKYYRLVFVHLTRETTMAKDRRPEDPLVQVFALKSRN